MLGRRALRVVERLVPPIRIERHEARPVLGEDPPEPLAVDELDVREVPEQLDRAPRVRLRPPAERVVVGSGDDLANLLRRCRHDLAGIVIAEEAELVLDQRVQLPFAHAGPPIAPAVSLVRSAPTW